MFKNISESHEERNKMEAGAKGQPLMLNSLKFYRPGSYLYGLNMLYSGLGAKTHGVQEQCALLGN